MDKENAMDFLLYSYFGLTSADLVPGQKDKVMDRCIDRAYQDFCRTLTFCKDVGNAERKQFRSGIASLVKSGVDTLLTSDEDSFSSRHTDACNDMTKKAAEFNVLEQGFHYGQAQKWLNMTIKYMWLLGLWKDELDKLISVIHIPVDNYIITKASELGVTPKESISWSTWEEPQYTAFQTDLNTALKARGQTPLQWEGPAWIEIAKKRASK